MKKIVKYSIAVVLSIAFWATMLHACGGHCDFNDPRYIEQVEIFDMAVELYDDFGGEIEIEECISMAQAMYEMEEAKAEYNQQTMAQYR